jgi:hypothetical protein
MTARKARRLIVLAGAALVALVVPLVAQESSKAKKLAGRGLADVCRVPPYFGSVGLSAEQREAIFKIRAQHLERIEALQLQIQEEESKMMAESEAVLTEDQRKELERRRTGSFGKGGQSKARENATLKAKGK